MKIAILGCGYVANMYRLTLANHPELAVVGVFDRERSRSETMARLMGVPAYPDFDALAGDASVDLVLNLTNPGEHFATTKALLEAGKHVYTEKPVATAIDEAKQLGALARDTGLMLSSAPCTLMSPAAQTLWRAVNEKRAGEIRLVYAEMDDGMVPRMPVGKWINEAGVAWPAVDEFETGCTIEHAGYVLTWTCALFGPIDMVTSHSDILITDKIPGEQIRPAPDCSIAAVKFRSGVLLRLTNGVYADHDHALRLYGDEGVLSVEDPRSDRTPVTLQKYLTLRRKRFLSPIKTILRHRRDDRKIPAYRGSQVRDFCRGIADMAAAANAGRPPYLTTDFSVHITEATLACHGIDENRRATRLPASHVYRMTTGFEPLAPLA